MLTNCPECLLQISDKAIVCPHCGYPLKEQAATKYPSNRKKPLKRRRLPNGFGQISEIKSQHLRKPFRAMITVGKDENGKPICKLLKPEAYFETYNDAYVALIKYHSSEYTVDTNITIGELHDRWAEEHYKHVVPGTVNYLKSMWKKCSEIEKIKAQDFRPVAMTKFLETIDNPIAREAVKGILNQMYDYAVNNEIVNKNYARAVKLHNEKHDTTHHKSFTQEEMVVLWKNINMPMARLILINCYMGWRPQEMLILTKDDVNIKEGWIRGGLKNDDSRNRIVPIHSAIMPYVKFLYEHTDGKLIDVKYHQYYRRFKQTMVELGLDENHLPHDCRKHFITMAKKYKVDEYAIKRLVGHHIEDITEAVYTDRDFEWLKYEIEKIKVYE